MTIEVTILPSNIAYNRDIEFCQISGTIRSFLHVPKNESSLSILPHAVYGLLLSNSAINASLDAT